MPNAHGQPPSDFNEAYDRDLIDNMLSFVERHFNESRDPDGRAFAGLSLGGQITNSFMLKYPGLFGYYGMFSSGLPIAHATLTEVQAAALRPRSVFIGGGWQDPIHEAGYPGVSPRDRQADQHVRARRDSADDELRAWRTQLACVEATAQGLPDARRLLPRPFAFWE